MSNQIRWAAAIAAIVALGVLLWLSRRSAENAPLARAASPIPTAPAPQTEDDPAQPARTQGPERPIGQDMHAPPAGAEDLMPRAGAVLPKDPDGPVRDWRDFTPDERAAVSSMELDMADIGDVIERLESGEEIARLRGADVTADEQTQLRAEVDAFAATYEEAHDAAYGNETTVIEMSDAIRAARSRFDARVREIYGLSDDQFFALFPYRKE